MSLTSYSMQEADIFSMTFDMSHLEDSVFNSVDDPIEDLKKPCCQLCVHIFAKNSFHLQELHAWNRITRYLQNLEQN